MERDEVRVAAVAMRAIHDKDANLSRYLEFIDRASQEGVRLLVFPEESLQGYIYGLDHTFTEEELDYFHRSAEPVPGPTTRLLAERAMERNMYIVFGMTEVVERDFAPFLFNTAVLVGPEGLLGIYRKVHLVGDERHIFTPGDGWRVFPTEVGRLGLLICWDMAFPEASRVLTLQGAELLVMPTAWPKEVAERYDIFTRARAAENHRWFIAANQVGPSDRGDIECWGHSRIVSPGGHILAETGDGEEGMALATIRVEHALRRHQNNIFYTLKWRKPQLYQRLSDERPYIPEAVPPGEVPLEGRPLPGIAYEL
jgi:predicted amidohydrolase